MLESFVFLSGYLVGSQVVDLGKTIDLKKKAIRFMLPSIVFSLIYWTIFKYDGNYPNLMKLGYEIVNGVGHMWFLPMLFWCFVYLKLILPYSTVYYKKILFISIVLAILSPVSLPLRMNLALYFFPFFYAGYLVWSKKWIDIKLNHKAVAIWTILFFVLFFGLSLISKNVLNVENASINAKAVAITLSTICKLVYSTVGVFLVFQLMITMRERKIKSSKAIVKLSECCFGVYLLQQFILVSLYDKSILPQLANAYSLPWIATAITLILSVSGTILLRKTRIGAKYI